MKKFKTWLSLALFAVLPAWTFSSACLHHGNDSSLALVQGLYSYQMTGQFGPSSLAHLLSETGILNSDGKGTITGQATAVIDGQADPNVTFVGTYTIHNRIIQVSGTRSSSTTGSQFLTFTGAIGKETETAYFEVNPQPSSAFNFANLTGSARK